MIYRPVIGSILALILVSMVLVPAPVNAQSPITVYVNVSPTSVLAGEWASVSGVVINNSNSKQRVTITFSAVDTCGTKTDLGYNRLALGSGQSVLVTTAYPTKASACRGIHTVTASISGKSATSAAAPLDVQ
jgi:hypothetical protein